MLMLCAFIWGTAFVAQSAGSGMGAYSFLAGRSWLAVLVLLPLVFFGSIPCVLGFNLWSDVHILGSRGILDTEDFIVSSLILPLGSIIFALFCVTKYGWGFENYLKEVNTGEGLKMPRWILPYFKYVLPLLIFIILVRGLM